MVSTVEYFRPQDSAEGEAYDAFLRMLPQLRTTHGGEYVAVCRGEIIASGVCQLTTDREAGRIAGGRPYYFTWVEPPEGYVFTNGYVEVMTEDP